MARTRLILIAAAASLVLGGCDFIRFPGDGGPPPETPEAGPVTPPGAPGPPPPTTPVEDPYENSDTQADNTADTPTDGGPVTDDAPTTNDPTTTDAPTDSGTPGTAAPDATDDTPTGDVDTPVSDPEPLPPAPDPEPVFSYYAPGALLPGSGEGNRDQIVFAPDMVFPIEDAPTYLQSMVFTPGGAVVGGDQCDPVNYTYPWRDNFCEIRSANRNSPHCPKSKIHQGQDLRVGTPESCRQMRSLDPADRALHRVVAVEDGVISHIGSYSVNLRAGGRIYKYMHMNMKKLGVKIGDSVKAGDFLGYYSNDFAGTPTTFHLHFEITQNSGNGAWEHVPPYLSLVAAYERRENGRGEEIPVGDFEVATAPIIIPEGLEIIE